MQIRRTKVIPRKNLPTNVQTPVMTTALYYLLMSKWQAPPVLWGITGTLVFIGWIIFLINLAIEEKVQIDDWLTEEKERNRKRRL